MSQASGKCLPRYRCHKEVQALKIQGIGSGPTGHFLVPAESEYEAIPVTEEWMARHKPEIGGYWVRYDGDGYTSYSPAAAFESGYTRIEE